MGHSNAVFIQDANALLNDDPEVPFREAARQGGFIFWNHPAWYAQSPEGNPVLSDFQKARIRSGELHGIEVINTTDYSEEALDIALQEGLTILGTSDIHGLIDWDYTEKGNHRPITVVFAKERTPESLLEALAGVDIIYTYNGRRFDLPFIHARTGVNLEEKFAHCDLMYDCWRCNLRGGFKAVERQLGIPRKLAEVDGRAAVRLWWRYVDSFDLEALDTLLAYNKEDVVNLKALKDRLL